jgi:hypothetical protein
VRPGPGEVFHHRRKAAPTALGVDAREHLSPHRAEVAVLLRTARGILLPGDAEQEDVDRNVVDDGDAHAEIAEALPIRLRHVAPPCSRRNPVTSSTLPSARVKTSAIAFGEYPAFSARATTSVWSTVAMSPRRADSSANCCATRASGAESESGARPSRARAALICSRNSSRRRSKSSAGEFATRRMRRVSESRNRR